MNTSVVQTFTQPDLSSAVLPCWRYSTDLSERKVAEWGTWWVMGEHVCRALGFIEAGVETCLADCSGSAPFFRPPGGLCYPSPMPLPRPWGRLYPWIVFHLCAAVLSSPQARLAAFRGQSQAALWGENQLSLAGGLLCGERRLNRCQAVGIDHWKPQAVHRQTSLHDFLIFSPSQSAVHHSNHCQHKNEHRFDCNFVQEQWAEQ